MSELRFKCIGCGIVLAAPRDLLGVFIRCEACNTKQEVIDPQGSNEEPAVNLDLLAGGEPLASEGTSRESSTAASRSPKFKVPKTEAPRRQYARKKSKTPALLGVIALLAIGGACLFFLFKKESVNRTELTASAANENEVPATRVIDKAANNTAVKAFLETPNAISNLKVSAAVNKIDALVLKQLRNKEVAPNPAIADTVFLRRTFLSLAGRLPSILESEGFLSSKSTMKRSELISKLLKSTAYNSHTFNYWADILRLIENYAAKVYTHSYQLWLKESIASNKPYDKMVNELVGSSGFIWEDGAVAYYARDRGMPLDNMANTVRIFLGVRLECAQCHDHPFDKWTQKDFYQMAAFTSSLDIKYKRENVSRTGKYMRDKTFNEIEKATGHRNFGWPVGTVESYKNLKKNNPKKFQFVVKINGGDERKFFEMAKVAGDIGKKSRQTADYIRHGVNHLYGPLNFVAITSQNKPLKLPHDYQYDDAKPHDLVNAKTILGAEVSEASFKAKGNKAYANWVTSSENPFFTKVIVNRLWTKAFGVGLVESVDNFNDKTASYNQELFDYLCQLMKDLKYDMRAFQEVIYNTKSWQREAETDQVVIGVPYYHQGPILKRMSAEQVWDSLVNLTIADADNFIPRVAWQKGAIESKRRIYNKLEGNSFDEFLGLVTEVGKTKLDYEKRKQEVQAELLEARTNKDHKKFTELSRISVRLSQEGNQKMNDLAGLGKDDFVNAAYAKPAMMQMEGGAKNKDLKEQRQAERAYYDFVKDFARASELQQPSKPGSFLRVFGQSDREVIQNASLQSSVSQSLNMMNGRMAGVISHEYSQFGRSLQQAKNSDDKIKLIYQSLLTRKVTSEERQKIQLVLDKYGEKGIHLVLWSILNSKQFLFIQ